MGGNVLGDHGSSCHDYGVLDANPWQNNGSGSNEAIGTNMCIRPQAATHIVREDTRIERNIRITADMDPLGIRAIQASTAGYHGTSTNFHSPDLAIHEAAPATNPALQRKESIQAREQRHR